MHEYDFVKGVFNYQGGVAKVIDMVCSDFAIDGRFYDGSFSCRKIDRHMPIGKSMKALRDDINIIGWDKGGFSERGWFNSFSWYRGKPVEQGKYHNTGQCHGYQSYLWYLLKKGERGLFEYYRLVNHPKLSGDWYTLAKIRRRIIVKSSKYITKLNEGGKIRMRGPKPTQIEMSVVMTLSNSTKKSLWSASCMGRSRTALTSSYRFWRNFCICIQFFGRTAC